MSASSHGRAWRDGLRAGQKKFLDRFFQFREGDRFGRCARLENDIPPRPQLGPVLANGFTQPPLEPVPFDGPTHRARDGQSDPARALPIDPGEPHKKSQVAAASLGVHFAIVGGAQQARALRKPVLSLGSPHRELSPMTLKAASWGPRIVAVPKPPTGRKQSGACAPSGGGGTEPCAPPVCSFAPETRGSWPASSSVADTSASACGFLSKLPGQKPKQPSYDCRERTVKAATLGKPMTNGREVWYSSSR